MGGANVSALHPTKPIVAYSAGCIVIVHDLISDAKIQLVGHKHEVVALAFSNESEHSNCDFLISIDASCNKTENTAKMCVWNWVRAQSL
jgi:hypothetical protein